MPRNLRNLLKGPVTKKEEVAVTKAVIRVVVAIRAVVAAAAIKVMMIVAVVLILRVHKIRKAMMIIIKISTNQQMIFRTNKIKGQVLTMAAIQPQTTICSR